MHLRVTPPRGRPFLHPIGDEPVVVGRSSKADLTVEDRFLSRRHARLFRDGERLLIEDLGSHNGTRVNGRLIEAPTPLEKGDQVQLSATLVTLGDERETQTHAASASVFRSAEEILRSRSPGGIEPDTDPEKLRSYTDHLHLLHRIHKDLARPIRLEDKLELVLDRVFDHLRPEEGAIFLQRTEATGLESVASRSAPEGEGELFTSEHLAREVIEGAQAALVLDASTDERFAEAQSIHISGMRSIVAAPLLDADGVRGMIVLSSRAQARLFREEDMELLVSLASVAALHIRNAELLAEAEEHRLLAAELELARRIQVGLLPSRLPEVPGYELHGSAIPSRGVSGDYYVVVERDEGRECVLMVADVSGKGIAAALLTASLEALASGLIEIGRPAEEICRHLSLGLFRRTPPEKFATAFVAVLDRERGTLSYASAGHNPILLLRAGGETEELASTGPPLGLLPDSDCGDGEAALAPGDLLVVYTDGITEAESPTGEEYGLERLRERCRAGLDRSLEELAADVEEALETFAGGVPFADDRTLVLLRRRTEPS